MNTDWDRLIENHFAKKNDKLNILLETVREVMGEAKEASQPSILKEEGRRFSMSIPIPRLTPSEACWFCV